MKTLLTIWILLVTISIAVAQTGTTSSSKSCYMKLDYLDSASGKAAPVTFDLKKSLPTIQIRDTYGCKCEITLVEVILVRGKRPVASWKITTPNINLTTLLSNIAQPDDRVMINAVQGVSSTTTCLFMSSSLSYHATLK